MGKCILKRANLTGITNFLNKNFCKKKEDKQFSPRDVLGYIKRGYLPTYLGNYAIKEIEEENCSVKLYNIEEK